MAVRDAVQQINRMESEIKRTHDRIRWIFFEIDESD
jgi:uncharacterized protein (UPF0335 family)